MADQLPGPPEVIGGAATEDRSPSVRATGVTGGVSADELCAIVVDAAQDGHAEDIVVIDVSGVFDECDRFVICSGPSSRRVRAIGDRVEMAIKRTAERPPPVVEGRDSLGWVLIDAGDVVVHVFSDDDRRYYRLENLFRDAPRRVIEPVADSPIS